MESDVQLDSPMTIVFEQQVKMHNCYVTDNKKTCSSDLTTPPGKTVRKDLTVLNQLFVCTAVAYVPLRVAADRLLRSRNEAD